MEKERYLKYVKICERAERMKIDTGTNCLREVSRN